MTAREYRFFLKHEIEKGGRGQITKMAEAAQCQRSHLSRVLSGQLHLTLEQAFRVSRFLKLAETESAYFIKLVEFERSGDPEYRSSLKQELTRLRQIDEDLANRLKEPTIAPERETIYYSAWYWSAIHILVSIPQYQTPRAIAERLHLSTAFVEKCLQRLREFDLVKFEKGRWQFSGSSIHLSKNSTLNSVQHSNWRSRAVLSSQNPADLGVHYTVVQSLSVDDFETVKQLILKTIDDYTRIAKPSKEEELVCLTCDFFKV